ncbi:MAG: PIG-L family deacetylase [Proteobacteria bacterium]|nr:PIG-L family deacetylase [Pseudomonadota bacterium]
MRILVISPHADDEVIGCGGTILRSVAEGHSVDVVVVTVGNVNRRHEEVKSTKSTRLREFEAVAAELGLSNYSVLFEDYENKLDMLPMLEIISQLDSALDAGYDQVFFPYASHHQDHRVMYEACFSALREGARDNPPSLIAMYEYTYIGWAPASVPGGRYFVNITPYMERKKAILSLYSSQLHSEPHPISIGSVETLARMRGMESGTQYAEMFYLLKMVV